MTDKDDIRQINGEASQDTPIPHHNWGHADVCDVRAVPLKHGRDKHWAKVTKQKPSSNPTQDFVLGRGNEGKRTND